MKTRKTIQALPHRAMKHSTELLNMAQQLPFRVLRCREFDRPDFRPHQIRQPREYIRERLGASAIHRFLNERGMVGLLAHSQTQDLFKEMHWCADRIQNLARRPGVSPGARRAATIEARRLMSQIEAAEEELFIANRRLIVKCVKHYSWLDPILQEDFLQEGARSLAHAVRKFDFRRGTPFVAYAQRAVQNRLRNFLRDQVRAGQLSFQPSADLLAVQKILADWKERSGTLPSVRQLAGQSGLDEERVRKLLITIKANRHLPSSMVSLDAVIGNDNDADLYEFVRDDHAVDAVGATQRSEVWGLVDRLPSRERFILRLRFLEGLTLEEAGRMLKLTRARIKQIQDRALWRIRQWVLTPALKSVA